MEVLRTAIVDFCKRRKGTTFYPSEIVRMMFPQDWELFVEDLEAELKKMQEENLIEIRQDDKRLTPEQNSDGPVSISLTAKPK